MSVRRYKLLLEYVGPMFQGSQIQRGVPLQATVQGALHLAFEFLGYPNAYVQFASRTDSGVHALAACCHVDLPEDGRLPVKRLIVSLRLS